MIDLHIHTTASDGCMTPAEILQKCEKSGLELISISDHYSMRGYDDLKNPDVRKLFSGEILPACEFTTHFKGVNIEILGYGIDPDDAREFLDKTYPVLFEKTKRDLELLIDLYNERGFPFDEATVRMHFKETQDARESIRTELNKYPENVARYYDPESEKSGKSFLRREVTNPESPFFMNVDRLYPDAATICSFIRSLGGKAIVAHPGIYNSSIYNSMDELIQTAKPDGLEAWYVLHTPEQREHLLALCKKYNLIYSGGSDYHNEARNAAGNTLGIPQLADIFPVAEIRKWANTLKRI